MWEVGKMEGDRRQKREPFLSDAKVSKQPVATGMRIDSDGIVIASVSRPIEAESMELQTPELMNKGRATTETD